VPDQSINSKYQTELMKKQTAFALLFLLSLSLPLLAQVNRCSYVIPRHTDNWLFYSNIGLRFTDAAVAVNPSPGSNLPNGTGVSNYSDADGNLKLYTDGIFVYNGAHERINFGPNLEGDVGAPSLIVPNPSAPQILYIFTTDIITNLGTSGFNYSKVDLTQLSGVGAVGERNINLLSQSAQMVSGVKTADESGYWVVTRGLDNNNFYSYKVTASGVETTPVTSTGMGTSLSSDFRLGEAIGSMKISPKGDRIAYASLGKGIIELFDFNSATGIVSNPLTINPVIHVPLAGPYYIEFSPDGTKLYVTVYRFLNGPVNNRLYQYDLANGMAMTLLNDTPLMNNPTALQLGRDGKIYVTRPNSQEIGVIGSPNRFGLNCNYSENHITIPSTNTRRNGLPNFVQSFFDIPHFDYDTKCDGDITEFWLHNPTYSDGTTTWDFGDAGNTTPGTGINPTHQFSGPGVYNVTVTERWNGESFTTTLQVIINQLPPKSFEAKGDSMYLFPGSRIPLDGGQGMFSYFWQDGSNNQYFDVDSPGLIVVEYEDMNCCRNSDSLKVIALDISLPNAFTPDGNGVNDYFKALGPSDGIEDFTLLIYNRWGQRIWEAKNFADKWDGTLNGQKLPAGVYAWYLTFNVIGNISSIGKVKYKGSVTLLR
jgi:gliding motility-associated-like protein